MTDITRTREDGWNRGRYGVHENANGLREDLFTHSCPLEAAGPPTSPTMASLLQGVRLPASASVTGWTPEQGKTLLAAFDPATLRRKRKPRHGCHASRVPARRSELLSVAVKTIQQRQAPLSAVPKENRGETAVVSLLFTFMFFRSRTPGAFLFNLI